MHHQSFVLQTTIEVKSESEDDSAPENNLPCGLSTASIPNFDQLLTDSDGKHILSDFSKTDNVNYYCNCRLLQLYWDVHAHVCLFVDGCLY